MYPHKNIFLEDPPGVPVEILSFWIARDLFPHWAPLDFVNYAQGGVGLRVDPITKTDGNQPGGRGF